MQNPLIASAHVRRALPLKESCHRLRELYPQCPRVYDVAVWGDVDRRNWSPMTSVLTHERLRTMLADTSARMDRRAATRLLAASLAHDIVGRMVPLLVLEGRAWDNGMENLWVHIDRDDNVDWIAVEDPTLRVLPDDLSQRGFRTSEGDTIGLPSEAALITWVAHRSHRSLMPLFAGLHRISDGAVSVDAMWHSVGSAIIAIAAQLPAPLRTRGMINRRSQALLDALAGFGLPVRGRPRATAAWEQFRQHMVKAG